MSNTNECPAISFAFFRANPYSRHAPLYCVGYTVDGNGVASITVGKATYDRITGRQAVARKMKAGKTFEIVTVPHRLEESIILGAKYFLLTRERP